MLCPNYREWETRLILFSFHVGNPEGMHEILHLFSDRGTPQSIRHMNAYSGHTYKFTKAVRQTYYQLQEDY